MKMNEYKDYMRLLFDKYLDKVFYVFFGLALTFGFISNQLHGENLILIPLWIIMYYLPRFAVIYLPEKIYNLTSKLIKTIKEDVNEIQAKHKSEDK